MPGAGVRTTQAWRRRRDQVIFPAPTDGFHPTRRRVTVPPHVRLPSALLYDERVSPRARDLWSVLDDVARSQRSVELHVGALADAVGVQVRQLRSVTQELVDAGWLHVTTAAGRGQVNRYTPLGRARLDLVGSVDDAVDPGRGRRQSIAGFSRSKAAVNCRLSAGTTPPSTRADEEAEALFDVEVVGGRRAPRDRPWCGRCDEPTRHLEVEPDVYARCPDCHRSSVPAF